MISGLITASGLLIATSQLKHVLGITASGDNWPDMLGALAVGLGDTNLETLRCLGWPEAA